MVTEIIMPRSLEEWNINAIEHLLLEGYYETEYFDFKEMLPHHKNDDHKKRLLKSCCAFANSGGGFLVFGVKDDKSIPASKRLVGIDQNLDFPEQFGNYPKNCFPSIIWNFKNPPIKLDDGKVIHVIFIPKSWNAPHASGDPEQGWFFTKRTNKGNENMNYDEIRLNFLGYYEKKVKLQLLKAELLTIQNNANLIQGITHDLSVVLINFPLNVLESLLSDTYTILANRVDLLQLLTEIRRTCQILNNIIQVLYTNIVIMMPISAPVEAIANQTKILCDESLKLVPLVAKAVDILEEIIAS